MRKKLRYGALLLIILTSLVLGGNQVIIQLFSRFTQKLILENRELFVLEEFKGSLGKILINENNYILDPDDISSSLEEAAEKLRECNAELSSVHKGDLWSQVQIMFTQTSDNVSLLLHSQEESEVLQHIISYQILDLITSVEALIDETVEEIKEYEEKSRKARLHGSITVIILGLILIVIMIHGAFRINRGISVPIDQLVNTTRRITEGEKMLRVEVESKDEFLDLANAFNSMLDALNETSISEKYLSKILNHLYGALLVSDNDGLIRSVNSATCRTLKCTEEELIGKDILSVFDKNLTKTGIKENDNPSIENLALILRKQTIMEYQKGFKIPVYVTAVVLRNEDGIAEGMVVVGHDLTEEKKQEERMEHLRRERVIAIHEAQELERQRISRDLHDGLGQLLTGISYTVQQLGGMNKETANNLEKQINTAIQESKNIARDLSPIVLKDFGLPAAIESMIQRSNTLNQTIFSFKSYSFDKRIDARIEKSLYRICQEAVNNILKHANASKGIIELYRVEDMIVLVVEDDGLGFKFNKDESEETLKGVGLISMKERAEAFGGELFIQSTPGKGTEVMVEMPCRQERSNG